MIRSWMITILPLVLPLGFLVLFYFYPLAHILGISFKWQGEWQWAAVSRIVTRSYYLKTLWFTFWQAALSTLLTLMVSLPCAYVLARLEFWGKKALTAMIMVPFVFPTVVVAAAFDAFLGPSGILNQMASSLFDLSHPPIQLNHSILAILLAHVFYNTSVAVRIIGGFWSGLSPNLTEAARMLGASPLTAFFRVTLPVLRPAVISAALLIFLFCFSSFGVILILGGPRFATLEVEIYRQAQHLFNLPMAAALSLVQICFTLLLMAAYTRRQRRYTVKLAPVAAAFSRRRPQSAADKGLLMLVVIGVIYGFGLPLGALLFGSLWDGNALTLAYYRALAADTTQSIFFIPPSAAIANSLLIALITLVAATVLGLSAAVFLSNDRSRLARILDPIFMLPLSTSAVTLGFGFILALDEPPLNLRTSFWMMPLAHSLVAFPFVVRSVLPALRSIPAELKEAAQMLGATPWTVFRAIHLPIGARALLVGAVFAFTVSLGEFGASTFVARPQTATIPLAIYRFLGQPGNLNYGQAMAMSSLLMLATAAGFFILERFRSHVMGEF